MNNKKISPAVWFVPLVAVIFACVCTLFFVIGKRVYKGVVAKATVEEKHPLPPAPIIALTVPEEEPEHVLPAEVEEENVVEEPETPSPEVCPSASVPVKIKKPKRTRPSTPYEKGLRACLSGGIYPCAWEDTSHGVTKQFWLMSAEGPVQRGVYDKAGNLISETIATLGGTVTSFTEGKTAAYFEAGVLVKIRTSPYDNCNFHDWFFINEAGKQDVCQCAYNQPDCCSRSPYTEGRPRSYCEINPLDADFCRK